MHSVPSPSASKPQISDYTRIRARSIRFLILLAAVLALARLRRAFAAMRVLALTCAVSFAAVCLFSAAALPHMNFEEYEAPMDGTCEQAEYSASEPNLLL